MRRKIILKNSFYSVINYTLLIILSFIVRKVLIEQFPIEYAGYEALFTDVFTLLSIADFGMDGIITYKLYGALAADRNEIPRIMDLAKRMYSFVAVIVLGIGCLLFALIPFIFNAEIYDMPLIKIIYIIQIINLSISYFTGYKRLMLIADQKEYICLRWDSLILILIQISRIFVLGYLRNYYIYIVLCIVQTLGQNIGVNIRYNKEYERRNEVEKNHRISFLNIKQDIKNLLCHKVSAVVYAATDNIIITANLGLAITGLYSNYYMVAKYTYSFATKIMKPMQATIGNYLYSDIDRQEKYVMLSKLNNMTFAFASFVCNSLIQLSTPFIEVWLGDEYIQKKSLVILLAINYFIAINQDVIYYFRNSYGNYEYDKIYMVLSAVSNLSLSIILSRMWGLNGIVIATIIGHIFIWYGRVKYVYKKIFKAGWIDYWLGQFKTVSLLILQILLCEFLIKDNWVGIKGCILREGCVIAVWGITVALFYYIGNRTKVEK